MSNIKGLLPENKSTLKNKKKTTLSVSQSYKKRKVKRSLKDTVLDWGFLKLNPIPEAFILRLGEELVSWAKLDENDSISQFLAEHGIYRDVFYKWVEKYEHLKQNYEHAKMIIGVRREKNLRSRKDLYQAGLLLLPRYNYEVREEMSKVKEESQGPTTFIVEMASIPEPDKFKNIEDNLEEESES